MNRPDQFWKSIDTLATAYFEGTLLAGKCNACAVGNLVASQISCKQDRPAYEWRNHSDGKSWMLALRRLRHGALDDSQEVVTVLPYTNEEIDAIEEAFEDGAGFVDPDPFDGLMAVVDVLFDIHEVEDEDLRGQAKAALTDQTYNTVDAVLT